MPSILRALPLALSLTALPACVELGTPDLDEPGDETTGSIELCREVRSTTQEFAPVQITGSGTPAGVAGRAWVRPSTWTSIGAFSGTPGRTAGHEGDDYVHDNRGVANVDVVAASGGTVAYVRTGCPQSSEFAHNNSLRECGSGWGNHVVVSHGGGLFTRYGHLEPGTLEVQVGDSVSAGDRLALMGNSGRSEVRHLHFELGTKSSGFDSCDLSQSFDHVYAPGRLPFGAAPNPDYGRIECPEDYSFTEFNSAGGGLCVDASGNAWGPFTAGMVDQCLSWGGGSACRTNRWAESLARSAYGSGACPAGARKDAETGYCLEDDDAFGPFPGDMVAECIARNGGATTCRSARWHADFMRWIYRITR